MTSYSANLGFLFAEFPLPQAIAEAHAAGFAAVELHWPYEVPAADVKTALDQSALPLISLNTRKGAHNGLCAQTELITEARASIDEAFAYGAIIGAHAVHVMAGIASGAAAEACFINNLIYACDFAKNRQMMVMIEAINQQDAPGYFLQDTDHVAQIINKVGRGELRMMFDCYHVVKSGGDILAEFDRHQPLIGHVQFAGTPDRGAPDTGTSDYKALFAALKKRGWTQPLGAEYKPRGATHDSLSWMRYL